MGLLSYCILGSSVSFPLYSGVYCHSEKLEKLQRILFQDLLRLFCFCRCFVYKVYGVQNCWTYFNSLLTLRLPKQTHKDEFFSPIFEAKYIFGLEFMYCMMFHFAFVQYQMNALFAINRVTAIVFPVLYEKVGFF